MHEQSLINNLMDKIAEQAKIHGANKVTEVHVWLGALSHMSPEHFKEHFDISAKDTLTDGAKLKIETSTDIHDPNAHDILLRNVQIEIEGE
ncbi:MAG: hydrogenase maturation nickel metallochaperone HypA [Bdellovibrionales bacterium]|nr:hydrogenase maturation nickel metallochaperone HypA [Bdellovibrionales bacterium]